MTTRICKPFSPTCGVRRSGEGQRRRRGRERLPSVLQLQAAFWVTRCVGESGASNADLARSYLHVPTGGLHDRTSLLAGQRLLAELGLLVEQDDFVTPHPDLTAIRPLPLDGFVLVPPRMCAESTPGHVALCVRLK